ncbi:pyrD [Symbiodinium microadriaticum]|nr:pyrD [Symbiodinium microadriaticum]
MTHPADLALPLLHLMDAESAHRLTIMGLKTGLAGGVKKVKDPVLKTRALGMDFDNPLGLAAGFDKNAEVIGPMLKFGLGFLEVGGITPKPQAGNPKPRLFRLKEDQAVINRMGFNNLGLRDAKRRLKQRRSGIVGVNLGANKTSEDRIADYVLGLKELGPLVDFAVINISSPNTPGLRGLQEADALDDLLTAAMNARPDGLPVLLKIAPDLDGQGVEDVVALTLKHDLDGMVVSNTTIDRPDSLKSRHKGETGGLSGAPLFEPSTKMLGEVYKLTDGKLPLIGVGGISDGATAYAKIRAGASLLQLYSALAYQGPRLIPAILTDLAARLNADGFTSVQDAVGKNGVTPTVVEYLKETPGADEIKSLLAKLGLSDPRDLMRTKEAVYGELGLADKAGDELIAAMVENPILIERPIVVKGDAARIGRPPEQGLSKEQKQALGALPPVLAGWFQSRGWAPRPHQLAMIDAALAGRSALLMAPTGGGKTLAGFLPSLIDLIAEVDEWAARPKVKRIEGEGLKPSLKGLKERPYRLHTLYISPLKALTIDVARNLQDPAAEMKLDLRIETRTGDTPQSRRQRQRRHPPDILLTTPEQLALLLSYRDAADLFGDLQAIVIDEIHALENTKRGDLLALGMARLHKLAPGARRIGLSATVADPARITRWLEPQDGTDDAAAMLIEGGEGAVPEVALVDVEGRVPWAGHSSIYAVPDIMKAIEPATTALIFVNTRSQAERLFQELWHVNDQNWSIALHHGSLSPEQRRKVEAAMIAGTIKAIVCTSTLDMGIDWGAVDLVLQVGAPKGASRMLQRIGRANHRLDDPSRALFVPSNRFEVLECEAARHAIVAGLKDGFPEKDGSLDVLAQHIMGMAVAGGFTTGQLYREVITAYPYRNMTPDLFDRMVDFTATGGYALRKYDRHRRLRQSKTKGREGQWVLTHPDLAQKYRLNVGTIVEAPKIKVRLVKDPGRAFRAGSSRYRGRILGEIEEGFIEALSPRDTFLFGGQVLMYHGMVETDAVVTKAQLDEPKIPAYMGGKFPLSTFLAEGVRQLLGTPKSWPQLPGDVSEWLNIQKQKSVVPGPDQLLVETFPRGTKYYLVAYPFEGRMAHQTLGMLLTRRLERMRKSPMGFVASDYALAVWGLQDMSKVDLATLLHPDMLGDDLEDWLADSDLMKRSFRTCAEISGLIDRRLPGAEKNAKSITVSADLLYDVLRDYEPDHVLMQATFADASTQLMDIARLSDFLNRISAAPDKILRKPLERVSPLAVPVLLDIGKEPVYGTAYDVLLGEAADELIEEALAE